MECGWESCLITKWALKKGGPEEGITFLKNEIDVGLLMNAYHILMSEEHIRQVRHMNITREGLCPAGLAEREEKE